MQRSQHVTGLLVLIMLAATAWEGRTETRVMFTAKQGAGTYQLYSIRTDGTGLDQITDSTNMVWAPALGPDGRVAYVSTNDAAGGDIRVAEPDGTGDTRINSTYPALAVQWYDTNTLFYTRSLGDTFPYSYELWQVDTDGTGEAKVFSDTFSCWPMGRRHFHVDRTRNKVYLSSFTAGTPPARITVGTTYMSHTLTPLPWQSPLMGNSDHYAPAVSPDGTNTVYCADWGGGSHQAYVGRSDGSGTATRLMGTYCGSTTWGPSGDRVAFTYATTSTFGTGAYVGNIVIMDPSQPDSTNEITVGTPVAGSSAFPTIYEAPTAPSAVPPTIHNEPGSNVVTETSADIYVSLVATGGAPTHVFLYYGQSDASTNAGLWDTKIDLGTQGPGTYMTTASIETNRQYWYRAMATNSAGTSWAPSPTAYGYASPARLPFTDTFEPQGGGDPTAGHLGPLDYQNGWRSSSIDAATVQNSVAHGNAQSVRLSGGSMQRTLTCDSTNVWIETYARVTPSGHPTNIPPDATAVFWFNGNGKVSAYDGTSVKTLLDTEFPLNNWLRVVTQSDYARKRWSLWVNGTNVLTHFDFYSSTLDTFSSLSVIQSSTNTAYVDDVRVDASSPGNLIDDADGDRMPDTWERLNFDNDLRIAGQGTDFDFDGFLDLSEFLADTSPIDAGSLLAIRSIQPRGDGRYAIGFNSVGTRNYAVYTSTNVLSGGWNADTVSPIPGQVGTTMYTVTVDRALGNLNIRVGAEVP